MNPLDELLSSTGRVPEMTPGGLRHARAALDDAIAGAGARQNATMSQPATGAGRKLTSHWRGGLGALGGAGGLRGKTVIGIAATAAVAAAVATAIVLPSSSAQLKTGPLADSAPRPTAQATAKAPARAKPSETTPAVVPTSAPPVSYTFTATTTVTAAYVLDKAAQAAATEPAGSVPLVNGWPGATYWHTLSQGTTSVCPGTVFTSNVWLAQAGFAIGDNTMTGPRSSDPLSACSGGGSLGVYPIVGGPAGVQIGGQIYSWPQFAALPTDPAKLWPIVKADANVGVAPGKGGLTFDFETIGGLLTTDPVSSAMQKALYEVLEKIPGVTVAGTYTDSLGRTGTALRLGSSTFVVDSGNGRVLAELTGAPPIPPGCVRSSLAGDTHATCEVGGASVTVFISAGPAASAPKVKGFNTAPFVMPSVIGDTPQQAAQVLIKAGIGSVEFKATAKGLSSVSAGDVVAQSPAAGTMVTPGTQGAITVKS
jgi:hypothetical protein